MKSNSELNGTRTEQNILKAFQEESAAAMKYRLFAKETEYKDLKNLYSWIAKTEQEHAEIFLELLDGIGDDSQNLKHSIALEGFVSSIDYPEIAKIARLEGFSDIADKFDSISAIETRHKNSFSEYLNKIEKETVLKSSTKTKWLCLKCGHIHEGLQPPEECPVCEHSKFNFKQL